MTNRLLGSVTRLPRDGAISAMDDRGHRGGGRSGSDGTGVIVPKRYDRPIQFKLPKLRVAADAVAAVSAIAAGVASGELSGTEAGVLVGLVGCFRETLSVVDQEARLTALEQRFME